MEKDTTYSYLRFSAEQVVLQEVPGEVALAFTISGCPLRCRGCHSADSWPADRGIPLTPEYLQQRLNEYQGLLTCVLFLGGEWQPQALKDLLTIARAQGLATCLYTGLEQIPADVEVLLSYLKTGPWVAELGGLNSPTTNQRMLDLRTRELINYRFIDDHEYSPG